MPRKLKLLSVTVALASVATALFMLALSAAAAPAHMDPTAPDSGLNLEVNYSHDWVTAKTTPATTVAITVTRGGAVIATITGQADAQGNYNSNQHEGGWSPSRPDLMPGDTVEGATAGASAAVNPIGEIVGALNTDTISGAIHVPALAPANLTVRCEVWAQDANVSPIVVPNVSADGGTYTCNFGPGYHIAPGDDVAVNYFEPDGDRIIGVFRAPAPDLAVNIRTEASSAVLAGGPALFHVTYRNQGNVPATNVVLTDTLPAGTSFVTATLGVAPVVVPGHVTWALGTVAPGGDVHFFVVLNNTSAAGASLQNAVDIGTSSAGDDKGNNHSEATVQVVSDLPDLRVGQQTQPNDPFPGDAYRIDVDYSNNGPVPDGPVRLTVQLAPDTTLQGWLSENGIDPLWKLTSSAGGHLIFDAPAIPGGPWGDRLLLTVGIAPTVPANTPLESTVSISGTLETNLGNDGPFSQEVWTAQDQHPDLSIEKSWGYGQLVQGGHAFYNLSYSNDGNLTQPSVRLTDTLPAGTTFVTSTVDLNWGDSSPMPPLYQSGGVVAWDLGALPPGHSGRIKVELALGGVQAGATITNTAEIRGLDADRSWRNNQSVAVNHVNGPGANLRLRKNSYWEGQNRIRFELQFENVGTTAVENVRITDTLPSELVFNGDWWRNGCCDLNMSFDPATHQIVWTTSRLEPAWSGNIFVKVMVPDPLAGQQGLVFTNTARITLPPGEVTPADNHATAVAFTGPDLYISKSLTAGDLVPGGLVTFTINLGNRNNGWDTGNPPPGQPALYITDTLPAGMTFVSATNPYSPGDTWQPRQDGNALTWSMGGMCAGCQAQFQIAARISDTVPGLTLLTNTIQIAAALPEVVDPYPNNNRTSWSGTVVPTIAHIYLPLLWRP